MTVRKRKGAPATLRYEYVREGVPAESAGPSFSVVWKGMMGVFSVVMAAAMIAAFTWMWNMQDSNTKLTLAVSNNLDAIKSLTTAVERLQQSDSTQAATLATVQVQMTNNQTNASAANITLSARIESTRSELAARLDSIEREARWRSNMQQQQPARGR